MVRELATRSENKNTGDFCRGFSDFKECYQLRCNFVKVSNVPLPADAHIIPNTLNNHFGT